MLNIDSQLSLSDKGGKIVKFVVNYYYYYGPLIRTVKRLYGRTLPYGHLVNAVTFLYYGYFFFNSGSAKRQYILS